MSATARSPVTTHVLDLSKGLPAADLAVSLERLADGQWNPLASGRTDTDGRVEKLLAPGSTIAPGVYRLRFETGAYFKSGGLETFYPWVEIAFEVHAGRPHHHVPLLLSPFGISTYRGS